MIHWHSLPDEVYELVEQTPGALLLECAKPVAPLPWTRLFIAPMHVIIVREPSEIPSLFTRIEGAVAAGCFAAGFFSYECGACFEPTAAMRPNAAGEPLAWFGIYSRCYLFDHRTGAFVDGNPPGLERFRAASRNESPLSETAVTTTLGLSEEQYGERIAAIHEWISAGDVYQLNFTVPLEVRVSNLRTSIRPSQLYRHLRSRQPVEFGAFLHGQPEHRILSFSPELFFRVEGQGADRRIVTRPMKGTAPRGRTTAEDRAQAEWLAGDAKNRSENLMIVDLLRNDLGRLCSFGTVQVENLFAVERLPTLLQMTSTVTGNLRPEVCFHDILRALFPCGSITGAPKVRAMQLLAQIEEQPRGVYTGAIGYFSRERSEFNVAIRTLELQADRGAADGVLGTMGVGGGIVADSDAAAEYRECLLKAEFLTRSTERIPDQFSLVETLLWQQGFPLIELHLDRLEDSAEYFDFACNRAEIKAALLAYAAGLEEQKSYKVRLLVDRDGAAKIEGEMLPAQTGSQPVRVRITQQRTDPRDPMLFHKTTHRPLYAEAFKEAAEAGFADVLFLNLRNEVTEGAISNVFVEKNGRWSTPPVECGLLAGVQRRHLLQTLLGAEERVLSIDDLRQADAVYLANAVRGLRRVVVDWDCSEG
jgi:para-aminobenzoate synthetase/4-amino-4-deoxychorismate lyase